jgi:hypothetical protein
MEKGDIDLKQLNTMISWKLLQPAKIMEWRRSLRMILTRKPSADKKDGKRIRECYSIYVAVILLIMWPATLSAPILTSSINWSPHTLLVADKPIFDATAPNTKWKCDPNSAWDCYLVFTIERQRLVIGASEYLNMLVFSAPEPLQQNHCYHINKWNMYGGTSIQVDNATYPCIELGEIKWSTSKSESEQMARRLKIGNISTFNEMVNRTSPGIAGTDIEAGTLQVLNLDYKYYSEKSFAGLSYDYPLSERKHVYSDGVKLSKLRIDCLNMCLPNVNAWDGNPSNQCPGNTSIGMRKCLDIQAEYPNREPFSGTLDIAVLVGVGYGGWRSYNSSMNE